MSTTKKQNYGKKIAWLVLVILTISLLVSLSRQLSLYFTLNSKLREEMKMLGQLEEKNKALKVRLEEVEKPEYVEKEISKLLGNDRLETTLVIPTTDPNLSAEGPKVISRANYQKWLELFIY